MKNICVANVIYVLIESSVLIEYIDTKINIVVFVYIFLLENFNEGTQENFSCVKHDKVSAKENRKINFANGE